MPGKWPQYLLERAALRPPEDCAVVLGSTPVVSFGHPLNPRVATLGINPSSGEFLSGGQLLQGDQRRLATLQSIEAGSYEGVDEAKAAEIIDDCSSYFERNPYRWFNVLDRILTEALGVSYYHKTTCHLDLVQWATDPIWKELRRDQQERLLEGDRDFLRRQLTHEGYKVVIVNGATAMRWAQAAGIVTWQETDRIQAPPAARFSVGQGEGALFLGWSCNLQSQPGALRHVTPLIDLVKKHAGNELGGDRMNEQTSFERGTHFQSRAQLVAALERWVTDENDETIGDLKFGRAPWISFDTSAGIADINADTRRDAIERMLRQTRDGQPWHVIANNRGKVNKVVFDLSDSHEGWYSYLREPLDAPQEIS
ncbi:MAG TPA: hypothetical protein VM328_12140 [Fimbriimonadaceae bacterium]|jgi:hypothetical protein|nr:hypothetical protein [Fimbriimonadaceae bacterium]